MNNYQNAFTIIELLVVITIIVVLLALLTPALDKAIYQAELAVCGAQARAITQSSLSYAMEYKRTYPNRGTASYTYSASEIRNPSVNIPLVMQGYLAVKHFIDPFLSDANLDLDEAMRDPSGYFLPGYHMYTDWGNSDVGLVPMKKVGSKMAFSTPEGESGKFGVIISDRDARLVGTWSQTSHPDKYGRESLWSHHGGGNPWLFGQFVGGAGGAAEGNWWVAWYQVDAGIRRGDVDNNYGLDDGSVLRLVDVPIVEVPEEDDPRIAFVFDVTDLDEYNAGRKTQLPASAR